MKINVATHNKHKFEEVAAIWPEAELNAEDTGAEETVEMTVLFNREGEVGGKVRVAGDFVRTRLLEGAVLGTDRAGEERRASRRNALLKCGAVWGALVVGCLAATFAFCGANSLLAEASAAPIGSLAFVLLAAIVSALIGPLMIICVVLAIFHVEGGTPTAICSLLLGSPLMYCALIWGFRRWWKSTSRLVKWVGWIAIVCYSALATYCLLYGGSTI